MFDQTLIFTLGRGKQAHGRVISPAVSVQPELSARIVHNAGRRSKAVRSALAVTKPLFFFFNQKGNLFAQGLG